MEKTFLLVRLPLLGLMAMGLAAAGCQGLPDKGLSGPSSDVVATGFNFPPRLRYGATAAAIPRAPFLDEFGKHSYYLGLSEKNGIAYTCRGGHIDTMHLRIAADWTAYLAARSYRHLMNGDPKFSYKLLADRSRHYIQTSYPANWRSLPQEQRSRVAREVALIMAPYMAFEMVTWHEMLTWFGFRSVGIFGERSSAFSWEDGYSNLLGTIIASKALRDTKHPYDEAMTIALEEELHKLGLQPTEVVRQASESLRGDWYTGRVGVMLRIRQKNFDIGVDDGFVQPLLVPGVLPCAGAQPAAYPVPSLAGLSKYGFSATVEIEPHEWEKGKLLRIAYPNGKGTRIKPAVHFAPIIARIRQKVARSQRSSTVSSPPVSAPRETRPTRGPTALSSRDR
jgi:hypothetical protein